MLVHISDMARIKLTTPGSAIRLSTNCATGPCTLTFDYNIALMISNPGCNLHTKTNILLNMNTTYETIKEVFAYNL